MKIRLNRFPYMCPVHEDHDGVTNGHYIFTEKWIGHVIDLTVESEDDRFWTGKIITSSYGKPGWMRLELAKECFDVLEE